MNAYEPGQDGNVAALNIAFMCGGLFYGKNKRIFHEDSFNGS